MVGHMGSHLHHVTCLGGLYESLTSPSSAAPGGSAGHSLPDSSGTAQERVDWHADFPEDSAPLHV